MRRAPASAPAGLLARHPLVAYTALAYGVSWGLVLPAGLAVRLGWAADDAALLGHLNSLAVYGPALAALLVTAATAGRAGVAQLLRRLVQWRVHLGWYLLVLFGAPLVTLAGAGLVLGVVPLRELAEGGPMIVTRYLPLVLTVVLVGTPLGEEPGWRGFALPRLQARHGPLLGTLALAALWIPWHLPNLLFGGWTTATFGLWGVATLATAVVYTWVANRTGGSLLLAMLLHSAINTSPNLAYRLVPALDEPGFTRLYLGLAIGFGLWAALLIVATRGRLGDGRESAAPAVAERTWPTPSTESR
jgi:membrane protease YdiL (CAAX protease family)